MRLSFLREKLPEEGASFLLCCILVGDVWTLGLKTEYLKFPYQGNPRRRDKCKKGSWKGQNAERRS
jgi:hypothetical protein